MHGNWICFLITALRPSRILAPVLIIANHKIDVKILCSIFYNGYEAYLNSVTAPQKNFIGVLYKKQWRAEFMKIINPDSIHNSEENFIDTINAELDWEIIEKMLFEKHKFTMQDEVDYKKGDIVVYKNQIAYRYDFDIKVALSIIFGRDGKCLEISTSGDTDPEVEIESGSEVPFDFQSDNESQDLFSPQDDNLQETEVVDNNDVMDQEKAESNFLHDDSSGSENKDISKMAADIADMISDINQEDN